MTGGTLVKPAGAIRHQRARETGLPVSLYRSATLGLDPAGDPWVTVCETHGQLVTSVTRELGRRAMATPLDWCSACTPR